ncbi:hypothetical protein BDV25DRAFT_159550 [Aspergillus avenaceus]|uniref:Uncharacterized protein n=1 Tax=Aspergillus avenaceus TaxID=36643 RepID=A0A5N6TNA3_ASPAV|nr:hypothetical protein BDV25DRAFT_159550 [Aspergillus avenaceus]
MKISAALSTALLAVSASAAFDKTIPWGKRDYNCVNVWQGIPDNSTIAPGAEINIKFNRDSPKCKELRSFPGSPYSVRLYNNPVRNPEVSWDETVNVKGNITESDGAVSITIPTDLPEVADDSVWYLRLDTSLSTAPQMPTLFHAAGPFAIRA